MVKPSFFSRSQQNRLIRGLERNMIFLIGLARIDDSAQDFEQFVGDVVHNDDSQLLFCLTPLKIRDQSFFVTDKAHHGIMEPSAH